MSCALEEVGMLVPNEITFIYTVFKRVLSQIGESPFIFIAY